MKENKHPFTESLLRWYSCQGRDLPWRHTTNPYAIWLSEIILQQTRIAQGLPYWQRFMQAFPTVDSLAAASEDEVLLLWQGLGYYSRARHLHKAARQIVEAGHFPNTYEGIKALSGVGPYTAAAIASFAFGIAEPALDGNAYRVLSRYFDVDTPIDSTEGRKEFLALARQLIPQDAPAAFNQAMMDVGATLCLPLSPDCTHCPQSNACMALATGSIEKRPVKSHRTLQKERHMVYIYIRYRNLTAIHRRSGNDIWRGLWEPYCVEGTALPHFEGRLKNIARGVRHVLTHRILTADFYLLESDVKPTLPDDYIWIEEPALDNYGKPKLVCRLVDLVKQLEQTRIEAGEE